MIVIWYEEEEREKRSSHTTDLIEGEVGRRQT
jgi:hypothetical protein